MAASVPNIKKPAVSLTSGILYAVNLCLVPILHYFGQNEKTFHESFTIDMEIIRQTGKHVH